MIARFEFFVKNHVDWCFQIAEIRCPLISLLLVVYRLVEISEKFILKHFTRRFPDESAVLKASTKRLVARSAENVFKRGGLVNF
mgnify:CR=1 FL=1